MKSQGVTKVRRIHPPATMNACTNVNADPSESCRDILVWTKVADRLTAESSAAYSMYSVSSPTVFLVEEAEEGVGSELKRSSAECARAGLDTAELSLLSGTRPPPLDTAGLGAGASNRGEGRRKHGL